MAIYLNTETNEYPRHAGDLELLGWNLGDPLPENWVTVLLVDPPIITETQTYTQNFPEKIDGIWKITYTVREMTQEEIDAKNNKND